MFHHEDGTISHGLSLTCVYGCAQNYFRNYTTGKLPFYYEVLRRIVFLIVSCPRR